MKGSTSARSRPYRMKARAEAARATADRVLEVAVDLFTERPYEDVSLEQVASLAGVASRTLLRRFGSKESLFIEAMGQAARDAQQERDEAPVDDVAGAVDFLVAQYERWGTNRLRMLAQEDRIPVVADNVRDGRRYHQEWVERTFSSLLEDARGAARNRRKAALVVATDVYTWKLLRHDLGFSRRATERIIVDLVEQTANGR